MSLQGRTPMHLALDPDGPQNDSPLWKVVLRGYNAEVAMRIKDSKVSSSYDMLH